MERLKINLKDYFVRSMTPLDSVPPEIQPDGSVRGVRYDDAVRGSSWDPPKHLSLMNSLCPMFPDTAAKMLEFWLRKDCSNSNWWWPQIGIPQNLCKTMLLLDRPLSRGSREWEILGRSQMGMTGQNKVWLAEIHLMKGLLCNDPEMVQTGRDAILSEVEIRENEGLQPDWSFQQHGPQLQFGNYGLSWFENMTKWLLVFAGTKYAFPHEKTAIIENYFTNGLRWTLTNTIMDINACARQFGFARKDSCLEKNKRNTVMEVAHRLKSAGYLKNVDDTPRGTICYPGSGYLIRRNDDFFFSVKMCSANLIGSETCNSENMQGLYAGDGATYLYQYDNWDPAAIALRDWRKVPGTTELQNETDLVPKWAKSHNSGGACCCFADGELAAAMMAFKTDKMTANKAWFCLGSCIICMGTGISSADPGEIVTTLIQTVRNGKVCMQGTDLPDGETLTCGKNSFTFNGMKYILPGTGDFHFLLDQRQGNWNRIHFDCPDIPASGPMLTVWQSHGHQPADAAYTYMILPEKNAVPEIEWIREKNIVGFRTNDCTMIAFFRPGKCGGMECTAPA